MGNEFAGKFKQCICYTSVKLMIFMNPEGINGVMNNYLPL